jgi:tRNA nucleotidyltransferase (CCA-adding enzyme)
MTVKELAASLGGRLFLVGGAVRDKVLGKRPKDLDFVITGVKLEDVPFDKVAGKDFPVFLVEVDGQMVEVAMARTEKKVVQGYHGFEFYTDPSITIEEDLRRRDLTINAMAVDVVTGELIDPFGGQADLKAKVLRHTSEAFVEDPLRVYRVARFAAQLGFEVAPETKTLMLRLKDELQALTPERVWEELRKALVAKHPDRFFRVLDGLLDVHFPEVEALKVPDKHDGSAFEHTMRILPKGRNLQERFALLVHDLGKGLSPNPPVHHGHQGHEHLVRSLGDRLRIPKALVALGVKTMRVHMVVKKLHELRPGKLFKLVNADIFKQLRLSFLESDGRFIREDFMFAVKLAKQVLRIKKEVNGRVLIDHGVEPGPFFGQQLLQAQVEAFKKKRSEK